MHRLGPVTGKSYQASDYGLRKGLMAKLLRNINVQLNISVALSELTLNPLTLDDTDQWIGTALSTVGMNLSQLLRLNAFWSEHLCPNTNFSNYCLASSRKTKWEGRNHLAPQAVDLGMSFPITGMNQKLHKFLKIFLNVLKSSLTPSNTT